MTHLAARIAAASAPPNHSDRCRSCAQCVQERSAYGWTCYPSLLDTRSGSQDTDDGKSSEGADEAGDEMSPEGWASFVSARGVM